MTRRTQAIVKPIPEDARPAALRQALTARTSIYRSVIYEHFLQSNFSIEAHNFTNASYSYSRLGPSALLPSSSAASITPVIAPLCR